MKFGHQQQMSGNLLDSPKTWVLGTKNKCQETFWALQKQEIWAPKTNFRKPSGLSKNMNFGHQKQMSGNLLGSPRIWNLGTKNKWQETFWALQKHEFWAPKKQRKSSGLSKNMSFGHQKQKSGNFLDSPKTWVSGSKNKCQETFWALQKHELWAPKANVRKPFGLFKNMNSGHQKKKKPSGQSKNMSCGHQKQMSGNLLCSPKTWVLGTKNKCQETFWTLQKREFWAPTTNVRKPSGLSKNMSFGHQKQMSGNLLGSRR